jgi:hypothetical protein
MSGNARSRGDPLEALLVPLDPRIRPNQLIIIVRSRGISWHHARKQSRAPPAWRGHARHRARGLRHPASPRSQGSNRRSSRQAVLAEVVHHHADHVRDCPGYAIHQGARCRATPYGGDDAIYAPGQNARVGHIDEERGSVDENVGVELLRLAGSR